MSTTRERVEIDELLPPQEFKTLHIDLEKKEFLLNGKKFGHKCGRVNISFSDGDWQIRVRIEQPVEFVGNYSTDGKKGHQESNPDKQDCAIFIESEVKQ